MVRQATFFLTNTQTLIGAIYLHSNVWRYQHVLQEFLNQTIKASFRQLINVLQQPTAFSSSPGVYIGMCLPDSCTAVEGIAFINAGE